MGEVEHRLSAGDRGDGRRAAEGGAGELRVGCASWAIPGPLADRFPGGGPHLARYARHFRAAEINSSFHRPHRPGTYARWAALVPPSFRFSVKVPKEITHRLRLVDALAPLDRFLAEIAPLGDRLGPLLVQLPPSLAFDERAAAAFLAALRERHGGAVAWEPRHASWFDPAPEALLAAHRVARVAADPAPAPAAATPGGWSGLVYHRLHGAPRTYWSSYPDDTLAALAATTLAEREGGTPVWCIFDNTASGAAAGNALDLTARVRAQAPAR